MLQFDWIFCPMCHRMEWHLLKNNGDWECLGCRLKEVSNVY